jgi:hypothetical protein
MKTYEISRGEAAHLAVAKEKDAVFISLPISSFAYEN